MSRKSSIKRTLLKLSLAKKNPSEKIIMGRSVYNCMTGSAYFAGQTAIIMELANATDQLADVNTQALNNGIKEKQNLVIAESEWNAVMTRIGFVVQSIADTDYRQSAIIITAAGLQVRNGRTRLPVPQPANLLARFTEMPGTVKLLIKGGRYAKSFTIYASENMGDPQSWKCVGSSVKRQYIVTGLKSATRYYFKAIPLGTKGSGTAGVIASQLVA